MTDISNAELAVLNALWDKSPATAAELIQHLSKEHDWHEKTVKTLLSRLVKKQAVGFEKQQRHYLYFPLVEKHAYAAKETQSLVSRLFKGRIAPLVAGFASNENLSKDDIDELKALIQNWEDNQEQQDDNDNG